MDFIKNLKKIDPEAYKFIIELVSISKKIKEPDFDLSYNTAIYEALKFLDENYKLEISKFSKINGKDIETTFTINSSLSELWKSTNYGKSIENVEAKKLTISEQIIQHFLNHRKYWSDIKSKQHIIDETPAQYAIWDFCNMIDGSSISQDWYPCVLTKKDRVLSHCWHELISDAENYLDKNNNQNKNR